MPDVATNPIPRDSLRELIDSSRRTPPPADESDRETIEMSPVKLDRLLLHERTTADIVIKLVDRKRSYSPYWVIPIGFGAGILMGVLALVF